jgi:hypothetical protein
MSEQRDLKNEKEIHAYIVPCLCFCGRHSFLGICGSALWTKSNNIIPFVANKNKCGI